MGYRECFKGSLGRFSMESSLRSVLSTSFSLAWFQFKLRNSGSYLGILWYLLDPLAFFLIFLLLRAQLGGDLPLYFPLYLLLGLILFNFFLSTTSQAITVLQSNRELVTSLRLPLEIFPLSTLFQFLLSHFFEVLLLLLLFFIFFGALSPSFLWYPFLFLLYFIFTLGVSLILATFGVFIRDARNIWIVVGRLLWIGTPLFYTLREGTFLYTLNLFNPLYHFITLFRALVIYEDFSALPLILFLFFLSGSVFLLGLLVFHFFKRSFAEAL